MGNLIHLSQINTGLELQENLNDLLVSYDAHKVLTDISKGEGLGNYNVNDLLQALKIVIDDQLGTGAEGGGSVDERLQALKDKLQSEIDAISNIVIKDRVKTLITIKADRTLIVQNIGVQSIDKSLQYNVYYLDNTIVYDEQGHQLTYDFATGLLSGIPSRPDPNDHDPADGIHFIPITTEIKVKVFPICSFTLATLHSDFLLDNEELNMLAYANIVNNIVVSLSQNQTLITNIQELVGLESVQIQIQKITNILAQRVTNIETNITNIQGNITNIEGNITKVTNDVTSVQGSVKNVQNNVVSVENNVNSVQTNVTNIKNKLTILNGSSTVVGSIANIVQIVKNEIDLSIAAINARKKQADMFVIATKGQVELAFSQTPDAHKVQAFINGVVYYEEEEFVVDRELKKFTWTFTKEQGGFDLLAGFKVILAYHYKEVIKDQVETICNFDPEDASKFEADPDNLVVFDGLMHLKSQEEFNLVDNGVVGEGHAYSLDLTPIKESVASGRYKTLTSIEVL